MSLFLLVPLLVAGPAAEPAHVFALLLGNNRSLHAGRPELHYADDDVVLLAETLSVVTADITVLARADEATARVTAAPTRAALETAVTELEERMDAARRRGERTVLLFAWSGHGNVDGAQAALELEDGEVTGEELNDLIDFMDADVTHLMLDSCNAFQLLVPRGPGGVVVPRRPSLATRADVGIIAASSRSSQTYESQELRAGVFSFLMRSALAGGADADLDDVIRYNELETYLRHAASGVAASAWQPVFYVHPPQDDDVLLTHSAFSPQLMIDGDDELHLLRERGGALVAAVRGEAGHATRLHLPARALESTLTTRRGGLIPQLFSSGFGPTAMARQGALAQPAVLGRGVGSNLALRHAAGILAVAVLPGGLSLGGHLALLGIQAALVVALVTALSQVESLGLLVRLASLGNLGVRSGPELRSEPPPIRR